MGQLRVVALLALMATAAYGCGDSGPEPCTGGYHVCGGFLRDGDGRALILRGANLAGAHKSAPYLSFHQPADFARMREAWGFDAIRFLISWAAVEPTRGVYDDDYLDAVAIRMQWAADAGLMVVLDMHQDVYGEGFAAGGGNGAPGWTCDDARYQAFEPASSWFLNYGDENVIACYDHLWNDDDTRGHLVAAWGRVAERLAGEPAVVGFDPLNEPFWGSYPVLGFEADVLQAYMDAAYDGAAAAAAGNMLWSYDRGGGYSILLDDGSENSALMASVVRPYPTRVGGDPTSWVYDDDTGALTLTMVPDPRVTAPTEIALPPRLFPGGADVACGGCTVEVADGRARLSELPAVDSLTVTVTPR